MASGDAPYFRELARDLSRRRQLSSAGDGRHRRQLSPRSAPVTPARISQRRHSPRCHLRQSDRGSGPAARHQQLVHESGYRGGSYVACADVEPAGRQGDPRLPWQRCRTRRSTTATARQAPTTSSNNYDPGYAFDGTPKASLGPRNSSLPPQIAPNIGDRARESRGLLEMVQRRTHRQTAIDKRPLLLDLRSADAFDRSDDRCVAREPAGSRRAFPRSRRRARRCRRSRSSFRPIRSPGHPAYSTVYALETLCRWRWCKRVQANPAVWSKTAILVTTDEGGGYYDSGYIQILDFFGDGTRVPLIAISPFARHGHVDHTYYDHASVLKFIERNWRLSPLSGSQPRQPAQSGYAQMNRLHPVRTVRRSAT